MDMHKFLKKVANGVIVFLSILLMILAKTIFGILLLPIIIIEWLLDKSEYILSFLCWLVAIAMAFLYIYSWTSGFNQEYAPTTFVHIQMIGIIVLLVTAPFWIFELLELIIDKLKSFYQGILSMPLTGLTRSRRKTKGGSENTIDLVSKPDELHEDEEDNVKINVDVVMPDQTASLETLMDDLNNMIGLSGVKKEIMDLIQLENYQRQREKQGLKRNGGASANHLVFAGNPGTGKTTVARKVAGIYKELGIVSKGQLIEVDRSKLVGQYLGETARIVHKVVKEAMGGVLFIDEAYSLINAGFSNGDAYGQEAVDTLLKEMEDHRDNLVVIVAGYPDKMQQFLEVNPGFKSRFKRTIQFDDYMPEELMIMYKNFCKDDEGILSAEAEKALTVKFNDLYNSRDKNFGNGRTLRKIYEETLQRVGNRISQMENPSKQDLQTILLEDVDFDFTAC